MKNKIIGIFGVIVIAVPFFPQGARAEDALFYKEINLIAGYSSRDKWVDKSSDMASSLGFEHFAKYSNDYGDFLTTDLQMRVAYDSKGNARNSWGVEIHNAWAEHKFIPELKVKAGHFVPAFGLETAVDTHATLLQTLAEDDIGFKKDWGAELKGSLPIFDYAAALQLGSGMSIRRKDGSYLATCRISSPSGNNRQAGISFLYGNVLQTEGMRTFPKNHLVSAEAMTKKRIGLDGQYLYGPYLFKAEFAYGRNDRKYALGYLTEIDYTLPKYQDIEIELQFKTWINDINVDYMDDTTLSLGASYKLSQAQTLRAAFSHDFNIMGKKTEDKILVQYYFLGA